jgi:hypothetical protein
MAGWDVPGVVRPVAVDAARGLVALPTAGTPLSRLPGGARRWPDLLAEHAGLQRALSQHADEAVALGVPDLRPSVVPEALGALVRRTPLPPAVRQAVDAAAPDVQALCELLAASGVPSTVQHDDLHDDNLLVDADGTARLLDWGDCSVGHPFGVLLVTERLLRTENGFDDRAVRRVRDAYLEAWTDLLARAELDELADAACRVQHVARALAWERALASAAPADRAPWGAPVQGWLALLAGVDADVVG